MKRFEDEMEALESEDKIEDSSTSSFLSKLLI